RHAVCSIALDISSSPGSALLTHEPLKMDAEAPSIAQSPPSTSSPAAPARSDNEAPAFRPAAGDAARRSSPEMQLLLACLSWPASPQAQEVIRANARADLDWAEFNALTNRHRVYTLVETSLASAAVSVPPPHAEHLRRMSRETVLGEFGL